MTNKTARRFLLLKHQLLPAQSLAGMAGIATVFENLRSIQFDPLNPCGNNTDLVLQSRVRGIRAGDYHVWLYRDHKGVECFDKELCIVPVDDLHLCRESAWFVTRSVRTKQFLREHEEEIRQLLERIRRDGELSSAHISDLRKVSQFWGNPRWGKAALEALWKTGQLVITKREKGRKFYDLPQKLFKDKYSWPVEDKLEPGQLLRRVESVGLLPVSGTGQGWLGMGTGKEIQPLLKALVSQEKLIEVEVEGLRKSFVMSRKDISITEKARLVEPDNKMVFLAPLDNLLWDRNTIREIFGFAYKWEVYTPKHQRIYGHYALPILYGDRFVGRIEPRRTGDKLQVRGLWMEPDFRWNEKTSKAFDLCLETFREYTGALSIKWLCAKAGLPTT